MKLPSITAALAALLLCACGQDNLKQTIEHFWDDYDFSSQKGLDPIEDAQNRFGDYMTLLGKTDTSTAAQSIRDFLNKAAADTVSYFVYSDFFVSALYPADSPFRNTDLFRIYLRKAIEDGIAQEYLRFDEREMLRKSYLNQKGSIAENGELKIVNGPITNVSELAAESKRTRLMLVGQAGCRSCAEMMQKMAEKEPKGIRLVAVVEHSWRGEAEWLRDELPERWTVAVAGDSFLENYDFYLAPVAYLLNRKGKILSVK